MEVTITPSPNNPSWAMWKDPDGIVWEIARIEATQDRAEYMEARPFWNGTGSMNDEKAIRWEEFTEETLNEETMKALDEFFNGRGIGTIFNGVPVLPSTASDINRIDNAINLLGQACDTYDKENGQDPDNPGEGSAWKFLEPVFDALGDARNGLIYLNGKLNERG